MIARIYGPEFIQSPNPQTQINPESKLDPKWNSPNPAIATSPALKLRSERPNINWSNWSGLLRWSTSLFLRNSHFMKSLLKFRGSLGSSVCPRLFFSTVNYVAEEKKEATGSIHPTAVVHPHALIGQGVSIGAFCTIGSQAKLGNGCQMYPASHIFGNTELGDSCVLMTGAVVGDDLPGHTVIGSNNIIGHHAVLGVKCQDMKFKAGDECFLYVGNNNEIREHSSVHRSSKSTDQTVIGNNNLIMGSCHIAHDCKIGNNNIFANNTLLAGHVVVEDHAHTAGAIVVHQFCHIGSFSFIGGGSVISQDVPNYMMVSGERAELCGLNLEGLRRRGFTDKEIRSLRRAYRKIFMPSNANSMGFEERIADVEQDEELSSIASVCSMIQSIRDSFSQNRRGICKFRQWSGQ